MSGWWSLPQAAPILLRHFSAYAELAERDIAVAQRQFSTRLIATAIAFLACLFTLVMVCVAVIALTWDTPQRMTAIYSMLGVFVTALLIAVAYLSQVISRHQTFLASVKREWAIDRIVLDRLLSGTESNVGAHANGNEQTVSELRG